MKKFLILVLISMGTSLYTTYAQNGISFRDITFQEACEMAGEQGKMVFVDCHAKWCNPCKRMEQEVFTLEKVGNYFNSRFINIKIDIDKNTSLRDEWAVTAVPTFLVISPDGTIIHRMTGGSDADTFLANIERGVNPGTRLENLRDKYTEDGLSDSELFDFWIALNLAKENKTAAEVSDELRRRLPAEVLSEENYWRIFETSRITDNNFQYLEDNIGLFREKQGRNKIDDFLIRAYKAQINQSYVALSNGAFEKRLEPLYTIYSRIGEISEKNDIAIDGVLRSRIMLVELFHNNDIKGLLKYLRNDKESENFDNNMMSVIQYIIQYGTDAQKKEMRRIVKSHLPNMSDWWQRNISAVLEQHQ